MAWYVKAKYKEKNKIMLHGYIDTDSCILYITTEDIYPDIAKDYEARFDTSTYEMNKKVICVMKD